MAAFRPEANPYLTLARPDLEHLSMLPATLPKVAVQLRFAVSDESNESDMIRSYRADQHFEVKTYELFMATDKMRPADCLQSHPFTIWLTDHSYTALHQSLRRELFALGWTYLRGSLKVAVRLNDTARSLRDWTAESHGDMPMFIALRPSNEVAPCILLKEDWTNLETGFADKEGSRAVQKLLARMEALALEESWWEGEEEGLYGKEALMRLGMLVKE